MKTVLITGATGDVGTHLRRELAGKYSLRSSDKRPLKPAKGEKFMRADISKMSDALRITKGVDAVVHLGGYSVEGPWDGILKANIIGCYNVFEAALDAGRLAGCAMDVGRAPDQMPTPRLAARRDVIATPHAAGLTQPAIEHQSLETVAQAGEILKGRAPKGAVNAGHWTRKVKG